jgi:hypothetical protein
LTRSASASYALFRRAHARIGLRDVLSVPIAAVTHAESGTADAHATGSGTTDSDP